jgi:hypothetical protein
MRVTILAHKHEDPESPLAEGPVLEIIRSVESALQWLPAATRTDGKHLTAVAASAGFSAPDL